MDSEGDLEDSMAELDTFIVIDEDALEQALAAAVNCTILAAARPQRSRVLATLGIGIRRPFSVSEVEALVDVVERLGTGRCANGETSLERFMSVVAWSISTLCPLTFGLAPFNPILGENKHVSRGNLNVLLEQVSHHPPVSALHATNEKDNIEMTWCQYAILKFNDTTITGLSEGRSYPYQKWKPFTISMVIRIAKDTSNGKETLIYSAKDVISALKTPIVKDAQYLGSVTGCFRLRRGAWMGGCGRKCGLLIGGAESAWMGENMVGGVVSGVTRGGVVPGVDWGGAVTAGIRGVDAELMRDCDGITTSPGKDGRVGPDSGSCLPGMAMGVGILYREDYRTYWRAGNTETATTFLTLQDSDVFYDFKQMLSQNQSSVPPQLARHEASRLGLSSLNFFCDALKVVLTRST
ncbi:oxysterol-binding protein-related protein 4C-like protein isoform X1 [Tanacetum coccineum]